MSQKSTEVWELWYSKAAAAGLYFARCKIDAQDVVIVHSPAEVLTVYVRDSEGNLKARGEDLKATSDAPMARLTRKGGQVEREEIWPDESDKGRVVILPGGEAGVLQGWWNAEDRSEWRWTVEFYNHR